MIHHDVLKPSSDKKGFTIVELLIVIVVIGILAAIVIAYLNPAEISALARDSNRITDTNNIKRAIDLFAIDKTDPTLLGVSQKVYISIPDTSATCANITSLPTLPSGWSYGCVTAANLRNVNGTGWLPINFTALATSSPMNLLPIDPQNDAISGKYYTYTVNNTNGLYEVSSLLESQKENSTAINDGGSLPGVYQAGTSIGLTPPTRDKGLVGYWTFDGTSLGSIANGQTLGLADYSGKGNNGTASNTNTTGMSFVAGRVGNAINFDGVDDGITIADSGVYNDIKPVSISLYAKTAVVAPDDAYGDRLFTIYRGAGSTRVSVGFVSSGHITAGWESSYPVISTDESYNDGLWHYIVLAYDDPIMKLYVDGVLKKSSSMSFATPIGETSPRIGGFDNTTGQYDGTMDDVRFYNRTLSSDEVKAIYNATK